MIFRRTFFLAASAAFLLGAPSLKARTFTDDGAWCWFSDPRAIQRDGKIFAGWMTTDGSVQVGAYDPKTTALAKTTLAPQFERDDHDNPALLFLPDSRLAAFYSRHARGDMHLRITKRPGDVSEWAPERTLGFEDKSGRKGVTYANPALLRDEANTIYVFWRGSDFKPTFATSKDLGATWSAPRTLIRRPGTNDVNRPYVKVWTDSRGRIDFVFTDGHPRDEPTNSVYFLRYEKGAFFKADGTRIGGMADLPIDPAKCDRIYDGATAGRAWIWDLAEQDGHPVVAYTRLPAETDHRYHYARWDGTRWVDSEMTPAGKWFPHTPPGTKEREPHYSAGMALDHGNPRVVYLARPVKGIFEIEQWLTADGGTSWTHRAITDHSTADNVRPFVVRNAPAGSPNLLWMKLADYRHYTDYRTSLEIATADATP